MERMGKRLEERFLSMQQCFLSQLVIISDKLDAVVAAMSHPGISNQPTPSGLLTAVEDIQGNHAPRGPPRHQRHTIAQPGD